MAMTYKMAWATGLFEGEGTLGVSGRHTYMRVVMSDEDIVRRFHAVVGVGYVTGPHVYKGSTKLLWAWRTGRTHDCARLLRQMWPLLGPRRREQGRAIIERSLARDPKLPGRPSLWTPPEWSE